MNYSSIMLSPQLTQNFTKLINPKFHQAHQPIVRSFRASPTPSPSAAKFRPGDVCAGALDEIFAISAGEVNQRFAGATRQKRQPLKVRRKQFGTNPTRIHREMGTYAL